MKTWMAASVAAVLAAGLVKQATAQETVAKPEPVPAPAPIPVRTIVISLEDRKLALVEDGQTKKVYTVAVGKPSTPSPVGSFNIERRIANPTYHRNGRTVLPGPRNPVGTRWMGLSISGYGIHGTNEPNSIGKAASHGCIRMAKPDLEEFFELVAVGDKVEIVGQRNEETAGLFEPVPPAPTSRVQATNTAPASAQATQSQAAPSQTAPSLENTANLIRAVVPAVAAALAR